MSLIIQIDMFTRLFTLTIMDKNQQIIENKQFNNETEYKIFLHEFIEQSKEQINITLTSTSFSFVEKYVDELVKLKTHEYANKINKIEVV